MEENAQKYFILHQKIRVYPMKEYTLRHCKGLAIIAIYVENGWERDEKCAVSCAFSAKYETLFNLIVYSYFLKKGDCNEEKNNNMRHSTAPVFTNTAHLFWYYR